MYDKLLNESLVDFSYDCDDPNGLAKAYESITTSVLDKVCLVITKESTIRPRLPCYSENVHTQGRVRRKLERKWQKSQNDQDDEAFLTQKRNLSLT